MNPEVVLTFLRYEIKRSIARRKIVALGFFTLLIGTAPYFLLSYLGGGHGVLMTILRPYFGYLWVVGVFLPQTFFIPFTAILISGGAMSEEYEQGTAELLLSKPVTKADYFAGKFLGGYLLIVFLVGLNTVLSVISATLTFGTQTGLFTIPLVFAAEIFGALLFFGVGFMFGEVVRRSSLSYIISSALFFTCEIFGLALTLIYTLTSLPFYRQVQLFLPTSPMASLPLLVEQPYLPTRVDTLLTFATFGGAVETSLAFSIGLILLYFGSVLIVSFVYFERADVSRKVS
jgi:ABC-2 type transport system permease protein